MQIKHLTLALIAVSVVAVSGVVIAADHDEADTAAEDDDAADLGDLYAFHDDTRLTLLLAFDGYLLRGDEPNYDADVLYGFHIDTDGDNVADTDIYARFGQDSAGDWGIQVMGIPGVTEPVVGPVDEVLTDGGASVYAGLRDDPFFFDREGFLDTLSTGTLSFDPNRDFVALKNSMAIAIEFDHAALDGTSIAVWATTGRKS